MQRNTSRGRVITASLCVLLWLAVGMLSVSPHLHEQLHSDPASPSHECILTLLHKGNVLPGPTTILAPQADLVVLDLPQHRLNEPFSSTDLRLSPSRAPPVFSFDC